MIVPERKANAVVVSWEGQKIHPWGQDFSPIWKGIFVPDEKLLITMDPVSGTIYGAECSLEDIEHLKGLSVGEINISLGLISSLKEKLAATQTLQAYLEEVKKIVG